MAYADDSMLLAEVPRSMDIIIIIKKDLISVLPNC